MKAKRNNKGQAMVEYIIIVVLIAITLIVLFGRFGRVIGTRVAGAAEALDKDANTGELVDALDDDKRIRNLKPDGTFD